MKPLRRSVLLLVLVACGWLCQSLPAQIPSGSNQVQQREGFGWLNPPPDPKILEGKFLEIPEGDYYEVVTSKMTTAAARDLKDRAYAKLTLEEARYFTGPYFQCPQGKTSYLVRAVYGHGGTGKYWVSRSGSEIHVAHGSLGLTVVANKSALVVNLDFEPKVIYTSVSFTK